MLFSENNLTLGIIKIRNFDLNTNKQMYWICIVVLHKKIIFFSLIIKKKFKFQRHIEFLFYINIGKNKNQLFYAYYSAS